MLKRGQVEHLITCAKMGGGMDYRDNPELAVLMVLMYYAPMKLVDAAKLTREDLSEGKYTSIQKGVVEFTIPEEQMAYLRLYIYMEKVEAGEPILKNTRRAFEKAFRKIAETEGISARLSDVYYAGEKEKNKI